MMVVPVDAEVHEAQQVRQKDRHERAERSEGIAARRAQSEHRNRDHDRDDGITECLEPSRRHYLTRVVVALTRRGHRGIVAQTRHRRQPWLLSCSFGKTSRMTDFEDADLRGAQFREVNLTGAQFEGANFTGVKMRDVWLVNTEIDGMLVGVKINGVDVTSYVTSELKRINPERALWEPTDPDGMRAAWR